MIETGYKLVRTRPIKKYEEIVFYSLFSELKLLYSNKKTYHRFGDGGLSLFDTYENAFIYYNKLCRFNNDNYIKDNNISIFECKYKKEVIIHKGYNNLFYSYYKNINKSFDPNRVIMIPLDELPKGTIIARWIRLIKDITPKIK